MAEPEADHVSHSPPELRLHHVMGGKQPWTSEMPAAAPHADDIGPAPQRRLQADGIRPGALAPARGGCDVDQVKDHTPAHHPLDQHGHPGCVSHPPASGSEVRDDVGQEADHDAEGHHPHDHTRGAGEASPEDLDEHAADQDHGDPDQVDQGDE